jgi:ATP-binding cassette subfamily F protein uup
VIRDFPGNYSQYRLSIANSPQTTERDLQQEIKPILKQDSTITRRPLTLEKKKKPSFKEKREFEILQKEIEQLNKEKETITQKLASSTTAFEELQKLSLRIGEVTQLLDEKELRWLELSEVQ